MSKQTKTQAFEDQIVINGVSSPDATIVMMEFQDMTSSGTAKRGPGDKHNAGVGDTLAIARAMESMARKLRQDIAKAL